jgi:HD-GYP domain-containing protein (c-di-GMP phosphodiesterase class II)
MESNNGHSDNLEYLNRHGSLRDKLVATHAVIRKHLPFVARIAVALYDPSSTRLSAYLHSGDDDPLPHYQTEIANAPSLKRILERGRPRVINKMLTFEADAPEHAARLGRAGYAASYTLPIFSGGVPLGFLFFNSRETDVFTETALAQLDVFGHLISLMIISELQLSRTLTAAVETTAHFTHLRDAETGSHLDRMSRFARLVARALASRYALDDAYIEHVFTFAPLHDIGKIGIPDRVLLKPGRLDSEELEVMRTHSRKGREVIDEMLKNFGLESLEYGDVLRNIAEHHHEAVDGSGYPGSLRGEAIPLEARIVAVADVFDALTSRRPYKEAWTNDQAFEFLGAMAGEKFDAECVRALVDNRLEVERIQQKFREDPNG